MVRATLIKRRGLKSPPYIQVLDGGDNPAGGSKDPPLHHHNP